MNRSYLIRIDITSEASPRELDDAIREAAAEASRRMGDLGSEAIWTEWWSVEILGGFGAELELEDEDPQHPVSDWRREVRNGDTRLGYREWLAHRREAEE
jgi:hypothetical protein